jgi:hypothetical protein
MLVPAIRSLAVKQQLHSWLARWLLLAIYLRTLKIALLHKLSGQQAVKQPSTRIDHSTPYSSPHRISTNTYTDHTLIKVCHLSIRRNSPEECLRNLNRACSIRLSSLLVLSSVVRKSGNGETWIGHRACSIRPTSLLVLSSFLRKSGNGETGIGRAVSDSIAS